MWFIIFLSTFVFAVDQVCKHLTRDLAHFHISDWNKQRMLAAKYKSSPNYLFFNRDKLMHLRLTHRIGDLNHNIGVFLFTYKMIFRGLHFLITSHLNPSEYSAYLELLDPEKFEDTVGNRRKLDTIAGFLRKEFPRVSDGLVFSLNVYQRSISTTSIELPPLAVKEILLKKISDSVTTRTEHVLLLKTFGIHEKALYSLGVLQSGVDDIDRIQDVYNYVCKSVSQDLEGLCTEISRRKNEIAQKTLFAMFRLFLHISNSIEDQEMFQEIQIIVGSLWDYTRTTKFEQFPVILDAFVSQAIHGWNFRFIADIAEHLSFIKYSYQPAKTIKGEKFRFKTLSKLHTIRWGPCQHQFDDDSKFEILKKVYGNSLIIQETDKISIKGVLNGEIPYENLANLRNSIQWRSDMEIFDVQFLVHLSTII
jgi:hypothetical protein